MEPALVWLGLPVWLGRLRPGILVWPGLWLQLSPRRLRICRLQPLRLPTLVRFAQSAGVEQSLPLVHAQWRGAKHLSALVFHAKYLALVFTLRHWTQHLYPELHVAQLLSVVLAIRRRS